MQMIEVLYAGLNTKLNYDIAVIINDSNITLIE
jgi:hypothetical protein